MNHRIRLAIMAGLLGMGSFVGLLLLNSTAAKPAFAETAPASCVCSSLTKLQYTPAAPTEPLARIYVGQCQCGALSCVVTTGALQCVK